MKITGVILAGGLGRRMGGNDKGLALLRDRPMVAQVLERFAPQVDEVLINANRNPDAYAAFGARVVPDLVGGFAGPLAGLHTALTHAAHPLVATVPCDSPFLPADLVSRLAAALAAADADLAVAASGGRRHPVFCLCRRNLLPALTAALAGGERRFGAWCDTVRSVVAEIADDAAFRNINTPEELADSA